MSPKMKDEFLNKLSSYNLTITSFFRYYLYQLIDNINDDVINDIIKYQTQNPGNTDMLTQYCLIKLSNDEYKELFNLKLYQSILPQHYFRYYIEKFLKEGLSSDIVKEMKTYILKRGPKSNKRKKVKEAEDANSLDSKMDS